MILAMLAMIGAGTAPVADPPPAWLAFARTWAALDGYGTRVTALERDGTRGQTVVVDYTFHKPTSVVAHIVQGPNSGAILVWNGGPTMQAHLGGGLLYGLSRTLSLHDPSAESPRGSSLDELSYAYVLRHGSTTAGTVTQSAGETIGGVATDAVTLVPDDPTADGGLTREVIEIATTTHLPVRILGYTGTTLVRDVEYAKVAPLR
jgi:hypothetical protein